MAGRSRLKRTDSTSTPSSVLVSNPDVVPAKKKRSANTLKVSSAPSTKCAMLTCGQGDVGQLGHGSNVLELTKFRYVKDLGGRIVDACAGGMHTVALDDHGRVWSFGCNDEGALGRITEEEGTPGMVSLPRAAVSITAGDSHSAALLDNGHVYAWGSFRDSHNSMGLVCEGQEKPTKEPVHIAIGKLAAAAIASGCDHLVILTTSNSVITLGCGEQGQLGRISQRSATRESRHGLTSMLTPASIPLKVGASKIWAGYHATFALDATGDRMFAWGLNNYGQLGITGDEPKRVIYFPRECDAFNVSSGWKMVSCGQHHTLALDGKGQVYAIGRCEYGRLGLGERTGIAGDAVTLEHIRSLGACVSIAAGTSNSIAITKSGEAYSWGMGSEGLLGTGRTFDEYTPARCMLAPLPDAASRCLHVSAGGQHTVLLVEVPSAQSPRGSEDVEMEMDDGDKANVKSRAPQSTKVKKRQVKKISRIRNDEEEVSSTSSK